MMFILPADTIVEHKRNAVKSTVTIRNLIPLFLNCLLWFAFQPTNHIAVPILAIFATNEMNTNFLAVSLPHCADNPLHRRATRFENWCSPRDSTSLPTSTPTQRHKDRPVPLAGYLIVSPTHLANTNTIQLPTNPINKIRK